MQKHEGPASKALLAPAEAIFDLDFIQIKPVNAVGEALARAVATALPPQVSTNRRSVAAVDGRIISQYARVVPIGRAVVRTLNIDMLIWFSAGLELPVAAELDPLISSMLIASKVDLTGNFSCSTHEHELHKNRSRSVILADRADIIAFSDSIRTDILDQRNSYLLIQDVIDVPSRQFVEALHEQGIQTELIPGQRSFLVLAFDTLAERTAIAQSLEAYINRLKLSPEHLYPVFVDSDNECDIATLVINLMQQAWETSSFINHALKVPITTPSVQVHRQSFYATAEALGDAFCDILDVDLNPISGIAGSDYREKLHVIRETISTLTRSLNHEYLIRRRLFEAYEFLWKFFHWIYSLRNHSLSKNETFVRALHQYSKCAITPRPFKPFRGGSCKFIWTS
jgi:hypothetical protein